MNAQVLTESTGFMTNVRYRFIFIFLSHSVSILKFRQGYEDILFSIILFIDDKTQYDQ